MPLPSNKKPVRVCDSCHAFLLERYSATWGQRPPLKTTADYWRPLEPFERQMCQIFYKRLKSIYFFKRNLFKSILFIRRYLSVCYTKLFPYLIKMLWIWKTSRSIDHWVRPLSETIGRTGIWPTIRRIVGSDVWERTLRTQWWCRQWADAASHRTTGSSNWFLNCESQLRSQ